MASAQVVALQRALVGIIAGAPALVLVALYVARLSALRADPSQSPGTPAETIIALMVATLAVVSFWFSCAVVTGRIARVIGAVGAFAFAGVVAGLCFGVVVMT